MFPLHLAALSGFSDCCRKLLSSGERDRLTHRATRAATNVIPDYIRVRFVFPVLVDLRVCRLYFGSGFDVDAPDDFGRTCLHAAAAGG